MATLRVLKLKAGKFNAVREISIPAKPKQAKHITKSELSRRKKPKQSAKEIVKKWFGFVDRPLTQLEELDASDRRAAAQDLIGQLRRDSKSSERAATKALSTHLASGAGKRALAFHKAGILGAKTKNR